MIWKFIEVLGMKNLQWPPWMWWNARKHYRQLSDDIGHNKSDKWLFIIENLTYSWQKEKIICSFYYWILYIKKNESIENKLVNEFSFFQFRIKLFSSLFIYEQLKKYFNIYVFQIAACLRYNYSPLNHLNTFLIKYFIEYIR